MKKKMVLRVEMELTNEKNWNKVFFGIRNAMYRLCKSSYITDKNALITIDEVGPGG